MKYDAERFLKEVLSIPSVNGVDGERNLAVFLRNFLQECGLQVILQEIDKKHANIIAVLEGETKETVVWNGHLDTVPYGNPAQWDTDPAVPVKKNGCYYVRGASDMKSGTAAMVWTLAYMKEKERIPKQTIYFCGTCDEEKDGLGAKYLLESGVLGKPSLFLIGEPTSLRPGVAQKGCVWLKLKIHGKTSHGAYPAEGVNAIEYGMRIFLRLKEKLEKETHEILERPTVQMSMAKGGIVPNMTPDEAEIMLDVRLIPGITTGQFLVWLQELITEYTEKTNGDLAVEFHVQNDRMAIEIPKENAWARKLDWELSVKELPYNHVGINYFTDASIFVKETPEIPVLLFGPGEPQMAHKPNEYVEVQKYLEYIDVLKKLF
ncbi:MAG: M20 family metallopeptidase [Coprococcus sp.]|nr:M20 family metallopeptidase [Coprococcus sp.]